MKYVINITLSLDIIDDVQRFVRAFVYEMVSDEPYKIREEYRGTFSDPEEIELNRAETCPASECIRKMFTENGV